MEITSFYLGNKPDFAGRKIEDIWLFDDEKLERCHDFIQVLFPLPEASEFNKNAPLLDDETIREFRSSPELQNRLLRSLDVMLTFLSMKIEGNKVVETGDPLHWLTWKNHNFRRLTRMMRCLTLLGLQPFANALKECLMNISIDHPSIIDETTMQFWKDATNEDLNLLQDA